MAQGTSKRSAKAPAKRNTAAKKPKAKDPAKPKAGAKAKAKPAAKAKPTAKSKAAAKAKPVAAKAPAPRAEAKRVRLASSDLAQDLLAGVRRLCLALPEATEVEAWGHPTFRVNDKIFAGFGPDEDEPGVASLGVKTLPELQSALVSSDDRFTVAKYVGKHGWVSMKLRAADVHWGEIDALVRASYRLVAPAKLARKLETE